MAGLFTSLLFPTQVFTASDNNLICGDENGFSHRKLNSDERDNLCESYSGKVILVVNTASRCAFTGQYEGLANLYSKYRSKGLVVVGLEVCGWSLDAQRGQRIYIYIYVYIYI